MPVEIARREDAAPRMKCLRGLLAEPAREWGEHCVVAPRAGDEGLDAEQVEDLAAPWLDERWKLYPVAREMATPK